mmetsp:Transcript_35195/g.41522  ORF Transcript_35195/g.41522 Transcript_35195/m.41522 type:complete len:424 (+) Transcript_35195:60-1331(+)
MMNIPPSTVAKETISIFLNGHYITETEGKSLVKVKKSNVKSQTILKPHSLPPLKKIPNSNPNIISFLGSSFEAAHWVLEQSKEQSCVLDFASDSHPGGGWRGNQVGTQEEALCRQSDLGLHLEQHFEQSPVNYMPNNTVVYVPTVTVIRMNKNNILLNKPFQVAVIAGALRSTGDDIEFIKQKIQGVLRVAQERKHRSIILGAWGCGAFGNDVNLVARLMIEAVTNTTAFDFIVFAIPRGENYNIFLKEIIRFYSQFEPSKDFDFIIQPSTTIIPSFENKTCSFDINDETKWLILSFLNETETLLQALEDGTHFDIQQMKTEPKKIRKSMLQIVKRSCLHHLTTTGDIAEDLMNRLENILPPFTQGHEDNRAASDERAVSSSSVKTDTDAVLSESESHLRTSFLQAARAIVNEYVSKKNSAKE